MTDFRNLEQEESGAASGLEADARQMEELGLKTELALDGSPDVATGLLCLVVGRPPRASDQRHGGAIRPAARETS